jgi:hypothetical protein
MHLFEGITLNKFVDLYYLYKRTKILKELWLKIRYIIHLVNNIRILKCNCTRFPKGKTFWNIRILLIHTDYLNSRLHNAMLHTVAGYREAWLCLQFLNKTLNSHVKALIWIKYRHADCHVWWQIGLLERDLIKKILPRPRG